MQRLLRQPKSHFSTDQVEQANQAIELLQKHVSPVCAQLFAVPVLLNPTATQSELDWLSHRTGQISPYATLSEPGQQKLLAEAAKQAEVVRELQKILEEKGLSSQAQSLNPMTANPNPQHLYAVDGQPVLINWLDAQPPAPAPPAPPPPVAATLAPPAAVVTHKKRHWLWLLLLLLLLLLVGAAAWWWFLQQNQTVNLTEPAADTPVFSQNYACTANSKEPPEFTLIFDTSYSMALNIGISQTDEKWFSETDIATPKQLIRANSLFGGTSRFEVAQDAIYHLVNNLHPKISANLLTFNACGNVKNHGIFTPSQRQKLLNTIHRLEPLSGTPSAKALQLAAQQMDGINKDGIIVLFIDGEDGCEMDICKVAKQITQAKPRIRANVVDISGFGLSNCVAEQTGGRIYSSGDANEINELLRDSIEEIAADGTC